MSKVVQVWNGYSTLDIGMSSLTRPYEWSCREGTPPRGMNVLCRRRSRWASHPAERLLPFLEIINDYDSQKNARYPLHGILETAKFVCMHCVSKFVTFKIGKPLSPSHLFSTVSSPVRTKFRAMLRHYWNRQPASTIELVTVRR